MRPLLTVLALWLAGAVTVLGFLAAVIGWLGPGWFSN